VSATVQRTAIWEFSALLFVAATGNITVKTLTEYIKHFEWRMVCECSVLMFSGTVVALIIRYETLHMRIHRISHF
jgi:hypothetical protein